MQIKYYKTSNQIVNSQPAQTIEMKQETFDSIENEFGSFLNYLKTKIHEQVILVEISYN